ncbi:MAG: hypothetical protein K6F35_07725, partial [Lachnospiraceae bacterium]|nr:hypothetical protein [Lachnospiraceae bacterium]
TITMINGENITVLDSSPLREKVMRLDEVFSRNDKGKSIEIIWFSKLRSPQEEMAEQSNLDYSEEQGYFLKDPSASDINGINPQWREGIGAVTHDAELNIRREIYIPLKVSPLKGKKSK